MHIERTLRCSVEHLRAAFRDPSLLYVKTEAAWVPVASLHAFARVGMKVGTTHSRLKIERTISDCLCLEKERRIVNTVRVYKGTQRGTVRV